MISLFMLSSVVASNILGWISIACWVVVFTPQLYENYILQSGEGVAIPFVVVWLLGDICNLVGAVAGGLLPTVIIIAIYYNVCDVILLGQIYYYRWKKQRSALQPSREHGERSPLLSGDNRPQQDIVSAKVLIFRYTAAIVFVFATGVIAWAISTSIEGDTTSDSPSKPAGWEVHLIGWTSAVLYLGARIPQIVKNLQTRCEGLSPAMFFFSIFGNVTYATAILMKSTEKNYLITNASWLAGSLLTVFLDVFLLGQCFYYRSVATRGDILG